MGLPSRVSRDFLLAASLTALAALLRLWNLSGPSLWIDESYSMTDAWNALEPDSIYKVPNYPISYALVRLGLLGFGWNEFGARILPCVIGILTVPLLFVWVRSRWSREGAAWSAFLLAISPWHLLQSQNARYYTLLVLFVLAFAIATQKWLERNRARDVLLALLFLGLGILTHPSAAFSSLALPLGWIVHRKLSGGSLALPRARSFRVAAILVVLLIAAATPSFLAVLRPHFTSKSGFSFLLHLTSLAWHAGVVFLVLATTAIAIALRERAKFVSHVGVQAAAILIAATLASFVVRVNQQYVVATLPFGCILVAFLLVRVRESAAPWLGTAIATAVLAEGLAMSALYHGPLHGFRPRWREASAVVGTRWEPGDLIASNRPTILEAYLNPGHRDLRDGRLVLGLSRWNGHLLKDLMQRSSRVWYVIQEADLVEWRGSDPESFRTYLADRCRLVEDFPLALGPKDLTVKVYLHDSGVETFR